MFVNHADMYMTRRWVIRTTESHREQNLKIYLKNEWAQYGVGEKKCLWQSNREWEMPYSGCAASLF